MSMLLKLSVRYLAGRRLRTVLTTLAIVLGVAVIFSVNTLMPTMLAAFEGGIQGATGAVDLTVTSASGEAFSPDLLSEIRRTRGIAAASPAFRRDVTFDAVAHAAGLALKLAVAGVDPATAGLVRQYQMTSGRFLQAADDGRTGARAAVVSQAFAASLKLKVGDPFSVPTTRGLTQLQVVGIAATHGGDDIVFSLPTAQYAFVQPNRINAVDLALAAGADRTAVKHDLERALGPAYRAGNPARSTDVAGSIQTSVVGLNLFGILTLFMGGFLVLNTFRTSVVERRHDVAMLRAIQVLAFDPGTYPKISALTFDQGDDRAYAALGTGRNAIVNGIFASAVRVKVGDQISLRTPDGLRPYRIVAVGGDYLAAKVNTVYISQKNLAADFHKTEDVVLMANLSPGANRDQVRARLDSLLKDYPQITLHWGAEFRAEQRKTLDSVFVGLYLALAVLIVPSLLGLVNTLAVGVLERRREIGLLRAVGATRRQVRRTVLAESLLMGATGAALGLLAGLALGYALTSLLAATMTTQMRYSFPAAGLVAAVAAALLIAVLASLLPARQATGLKIVQSLHYE